MKNREIILHCLKENTDVTCRKSPCDKPEQEGNTGECCDKCALGILEEYEREVRSKAIDDCIDKFAEILSSIPQMCGINCPVNCNWGTNTSCIDMCKKWLREKIKDGGENDKEN